MNTEKPQASKHLHYSTIYSKNYRHHPYLIMFYDPLCQELIFLNSLGIIAKIW